MQKPFANLTENPSLHNQKQKVIKSQQIKTVDALMKLWGTAEASLDPGLVSAAGVCLHLKGENVGTSRPCPKLHLPLQPVPRHKIAKKPALPPADVG